MTVAVGGSGRAAFWMEMASAAAVALSGSSLLQVRGKLSIDSEDYGIDEGGIR